MENSRKSLSVLQRKRILGMYNNECCNCGSKDDLEIHHIVPLYLGGTNRDTNYAVLCWRCHTTIHTGESISEIRRRSFNGPKPRTDDETAFMYFDKYAAGEIGLTELKEIMRFSKTYKLQDSPQFKKYKTERNIKTIRNKVDQAKASHLGLFNGLCVGHVIYNDGTVKDVMYAG